jgi:hypothetical protein
MVVPCPLEAWRPGGLLGVRGTGVRPSGKAKPPEFDLRAGLTPATYLSKLAYNHMPTACLQAIMNG